MSTATQVRPASHETPEIQLPVGVSAFPGEMYRAPGGWVERADNQLIYQLFTGEVRAAFRPLR
jgi:hypothetical protein